MIAAYTNFVQPSGVGGEVPHRGEEHRDAGLTHPHDRGLLGDLGHPHDIGRGVEPVEGCGVQIELVAQHDDQVAQLSHAATSAVGRRRSSTSPQPSSSPSAVPISRPTMSLVPPGAKGTMKRTGRCG